MKNRYIISYIIKWFVVTCIDGCPTRKWFWIMQTDWRKALFGQCSQLLGWDGLACVNLNPFGCRLLAFCSCRTPASVDAGTEMTLGATVFYESNSFHEEICYYHKRVPWSKIGLDSDHTVGWPCHHQKEMVMDSWWVNIKTEWSQPLSNVFDNNRWYYP